MNKKKTPTLQSLKDHQSKQWHSDEFTIKRDKAKELEKIKEDYKKKLKDAYRRIREGF